MSRNAAPPKLCCLLAALDLCRAERQDVVSDLDDEWQARVESAGIDDANRWVPTAGSTFSRAFVRRCLTQAIRPAIWLDTVRQDLDSACGS